jgi:hypothetical protein
MTALSRSLYQRLLITYQQNMRNGIHLCSEFVTSIEQAGWMDGLMILVRIPAVTDDFALFQNIHLDSYPKNTSLSFPWGKSVVV